MMKLLDLIKERRSVRSYSSKLVKREDIDKCIEAARLAPSACNSQEWHFVVLDDEVKKDMFCDNVCSGLYSMNNFIKQAPVVIAVISDSLKWTAKVGKFFKKTDYYLIDIGIASQQLVLQAQELGLSTCCIGWFNEINAKKILGIPKKQRIDLLISLGYANESNQLNKEKVRKKTEDIVSYNKYV